MGLYCASCGRLIPQGVHKTVGKLKYHTTCEPAETAPLDMVGLDEEADGGEKCQILPFPKG